MNVYDPKVNHIRHAREITCPDCGASLWYIDMSSDGFRCSSCGTKFNTVDTADCQKKKRRMVRRYEHKRV